MKTVTIAGLVFIALALIFFLSWRLTQNRQLRSFWDVVRNPNVLLDLDRYHRENAEAAARLKTSPDELVKFVDHYILKPQPSFEEWRNRRIIAQLGELCFPRALALLRDPSLSSRWLQIDESDDGTPQGPFIRLCHIFDEDALPPAELVPLLIPFLDASTEDIRRSAASVLGATGVVESLNGLQKALGDEDEYVKGYALRGIQRATTNPRIPADVNDKLFALVSSRWPEDTEFEVSSELPGVLLALDRERARTYLLNERLFSIEFEPVWRIIEAFDAAGEQVPRDRMLALVAEIERIEDRPWRYPLATVMQYALYHLGHYRDAEIRALLNRLSHHENQDVVAGAVRGLTRFYRLDDLYVRSWKIVEEQGWDQLSLGAKYECAVKELDGEVKNGGFSQYYFNSGGDRWDVAEAALQAIGADQHRTLLQATVERFPDAHPSNDRDRRQQQLAKIVRQQEDPFHAQDDAWYKIANENLELLLLRYHISRIPDSQIDAQVE